MVVRRDSLRAQTDFFSPMTGNTSPRLAGAPKGKYGDEIKSRMKRWQLETFKESYENKLREGISLYKKFNS